MKMYGRVEVQHHAFLTLALDRSEYSASHPDHFIPKERAPGTYQREGWVGLRAGLDMMGKERKPLLLGIKLHLSVT